MERIDITQKLKEFHQHLLHNPRTILSARFGDGKTYFLNEYFAKHQIWKDFTPIDNRVGSEEDTYFVVLHPVNYVVAKNEDVFEYIKRDILVQLYQERKVGNIDYMALLKSIGETLKEKALPMLGEMAAILPCGNIAKAFIECGAEVKKKYDEKKELASDFIDKFVKQKGGIYENDAFTKLICGTLEYLREPKERKPARKVLVIEDLDRLDPGHLFRILNVLGAHIDENDGGNKFGFDNIVLVLDYDVTEYLFHHFYGLGSNYEGYMGKFIAGNPFHYSIKGVAIESLRNDIMSHNHQMILQAVITSKNEDETLGQQLNKLSVRDFEKLIDRYAKMKVKETIELNGNKIATDTPIVTLISLLVLMNGKYNRYALEQWLKTQENWCYILGGFVFACKNYHGAYSDVNNVRRSFQPFENKNGDITGVYITEDSSDPTLVAPSKDQIIQSAITAAREVVRDGKMLKW